MKILNLSLKSTILCGIFCIALSGNAQDSKVVAAFKDSYTIEKKGDYNKAIEEIKKVMGEKNYEYEINLRLGWLYYESGRFTDAVAYYQKAIDLMPMAIEPRMGIVIPAAQLGNWEQVQQQYVKVLDIDPNNSTANYRLGMIYYGKKDYDKAYKYFEKVVNLYPFSYDGLLMFGWANYFKGNTGKAKILFNKVLMLAPGDASATEGLGYIK
ncbi:MAG: tetratricopeptide repeat protein [Bacteroidia bacterium]|nr:tetratricopeptide repeat protein [Bacteroidia bacterium]